MRLCLRRSTDVSVESTWDHWDLPTRGKGRKWRKLTFFLFGLKVVNKLYGFIFAFEFIFIEVWYYNRRRQPEMIAGTPPYFLKKESHQHWAWVFLMHFIWDVFLSSTPPVTLSLVRHVVLVVPVSCACLFVCLFVCLSFFLSFFLSVCLSFFLSF